MRSGRRISGFSYLAESRGPEPRRLPGRSGNPRVGSLFDPGGTTRPRTPLVSQTLQGTGGGPGQEPSLRGVLQPRFPGAGNRPEEGRWGLFEAAFQVRKRLVQVQDLAYLSVRRGSVARSSISGESVGERDREHHPVVPSGGLICSPPGEQQLVSTRDLSLPLWNLRCFSHCLVNHLGQNNDKTKHNDKKKISTSASAFLGFFGLLLGWSVRSCLLARRKSVRLELTHEPSSPTILY